MGAKKAKIWCAGTKNSGVLRLAKGEYLREEGGGESESTGEGDIEGGNELRLQSTNNIWEQLTGWWEDGWLLQLEAWCRDKVTNSAEESQREKQRRTLPKTICGQEEVRSKG